MRNTASGCHYYGNDDPFTNMSKVKKPTSWMWIWKSLGIIVDTCKDWKIKKLCLFEYNDHGVLMPDGKVTDEQGSPSAIVSCDDERANAYREQAQFIATEAGKWRGSQDWPF
jgi:hypothetical protein